jgi:hypothetical protein
MSSFLKNTGDIILDAVLTDEGRRRLSLGDGSFKITKFALGDDEINYGLYDATAAAGSEDTNVMLTPIFEAMTNNASSMKNKLISISRTDLLFLPVLKLNTGLGKQSIVTSLGTTFIINSPTVTSNVDSTYNLLIGGSVNNGTDGIIDSANSNAIYVDQGLDTTKLSNQRSLTNTIPELFEDEYNILVDDRLLDVYSLGVNSTSISPIAIDDDKIATYKVNINTNSEFVSTIDPVNNTTRTINGYQGSRLVFKPIAKPIITDYLFSTLGSTVTLNSTSVKIIRTVVRVTGVNTGYSLDIPVIIAKV